MKKNKKILMIGTAITSIVAPLATVISCGSRNTNHHNVNHSAIYNTPNGSHGTFHTSIVNNYIVLNLSNYKQYTTYNYYIKTLTIKEGITEISDIFKNGYIPDPSKPNDTVPIDSLTLPTTLEKIDNNAFYASQLTYLTIPDNVTTIGEFAFYASQLTTLTIPDNVITIGEYAFRSSPLSWLTLGASVQTIGNNAFYYSRLRSLIIPNSVTSIDDDAFQFSPLTSLTLGTSIQIIGGGAFWSSKLTTLTIPGSVYNIGKNTFRDITNNSNTHVTMPIIFKNNADKDSIFGQGHWDQIIFTYTPSQLIVLDISNYKQYTTYDQSTRTLTIEDDVIEITDVFRNGYILDPSKLNDTVPIWSLTLPSTLKKIDDNAFPNAQLTDLNIPNSVTSIGKYAFYYSSLTNLTLGTSLLIIGDAAFYNSQLTDLNIPDNVISIGHWAFTMSTLTSLTLGASLQTIGIYAFYNSQLINLSIPNSVTSIGEYAFDFSQLITLTIPDSVTSIGIGAFVKIVNNSNTKVTMPTRFSSDFDKDRIFGLDNWKQITFDWI